ncbi:MAG: C45 family autoproteolytic acyltransferase/hydrolase [Bradymonadia bacterium]
MTAPLTLTQYTFEGSPTEIGHGLGETLRDQIKAFTEVRFAAVKRYAADRGRETVDGIMEIGAQCQQMYAQWDPEGYAEHVAIAEGAGLAPLDLYVTTNMTDVRDVLLLSAGAEEEGCSSVLLPKGRTTTGEALVGQTWDLNPTDVEFIVGIHRKPTESPETWSMTCTGCLTLIGMNSNGLAVGTTNIKVKGSRPGVCYLDILHRMIRCPDAEAASAIVSNAPRAGAHTYWIADAQQQLEWEASPLDAVKRVAGPGTVHRTNHCLVPTHVEAQGEQPGESSKARFARIEHLLGQGPMGFEGLKGLFADRADGVLSVNRYPEDDQGTTTNGVFIAEPATKRLWACRGPADRAEWVSFSF